MGRVLYHHHLREARAPSLCGIVAGRACATVGAVKDSGALLSLVAAVGCVRVFPQRIADDDRGAHVYLVAPSPPGEVGEGLGAAREVIPSEGLTLVAQWGDDRGRYDAPMQRGPALPGHRHVVWNASSLLIVDTATGAPMRRLRWPSLPPGASIQRVAVDPAGRFVAGLDARGGVALGALDGDELASLGAPPREAASPRVARVDAPEQPRVDNLANEAGRGGDRLDGPGVDIDPVQAAGIVGNDQDPSADRHALGRAELRIFHEAFEPFGAGP